jgi:protein gp37
MADVKIEWTEEVWNPLAGCTRKSAACKRCYAEAETAAFSAPGQWGHGYAELDDGVPAWTGKIGLRDDRLLLPLTWDTPRRIFVNSTSDVFHESLEEADRIFAVIALAPQHQFQILTKRPKTMQPYIANPATPARIEAAMADIKADAPKIAQWPLPHLWLGVTAENQKEADRRIPALLETPAAIRFIAAEPLLETIDLKIGSWLKPEGSGVATAPVIDWVVAGGEVSAKATACQPDWARALRDQCAKSNTPFFWNQWGEHVPAGGGGDANRLLDGEKHEAYPTAV